MDNYQYDPEFRKDNNNSNINMKSQNKDKIATASLIFGILAVPGTITIWFGVIFGISAIALAIISRLNRGKFEGGAVAGITLGIVFVVISFMLFSYTLQLINNPEAMDKLYKLMESVQ